MCKDLQKEFKTSSNKVFTSETRALLYDTFHSKHYPGSEAMNSYTTRVNADADDDFFWKY